LAAPIGKLKSLRKPFLAGTDFSKQRFGFFRGACFFCLGYPK
jgi:hypothetical protein